MEKKNRYIIKKKISIEIPIEDVKILDKVGEECGRTRNNLCELIIHEFIENERKR